MVDSYHLGYITRMMKWVVIPLEFIFYIAMINNKKQYFGCALLVICMVNYVVFSFFYYVMVR